MSYIAYISFPKELKVFRFSEIKGREKEFGIHYDTANFRPDILLFADFSPDDNNIVIIDKKKATFKRCFKNSFIYEFCSSLPSEFSRKRWEVVHGNLDDEIKKLKLEENAERSWRASQQIQCSFIHKNLEIGEFAEIYTSWHDHINFNFNPPTSEDTMTLEEFLNMPMPSKSKNIEERYKLTIHKIK